MSSFFQRLYQRLPIIRTLISIRSAQTDLAVLLQHQIRLQAELLEEKLLHQPRFQEPKRLMRSAAQVCSQGGEDGMIREIFRRIGATDHRFVEIGIGDGRENNTAFLLSTGWKGIWIDGNPAFEAQLAQHPDIRNALNARVSMVTRDNIADLLRELGAETSFDLLSLDVDHNTYHIWQALRDFQPRVVVIEYNSVIPADVEWCANYVPDRTWGGDHNFGASLKSYELLGRELGYSLVGCDLVGTNAFFVRNELVGELFAAPFTSENHYEPSRIAMLHRRFHDAAILDRYQTQG